MSIDEAIDDYLNNYLEDEAFDQGERLLETMESRFKYDVIAENEYIVFVPNKNNGQSTQVYINDHKDLIIKCSCPASREGKSCHHTIAATLYLQEKLLDDNDYFYEDETDLFIDQPYVNKNDTISIDGSTTFNMNSINLYKIISLCGNSQKAASAANQKKVRPVEIKKPQLLFHYVETNKVVYSIDIIYDGKDGFTTHCTCKQKQHPICEHIASCFFYLNNRYDQFYFNQFRDYTEEQNKYLQRYGLTLNDPEAKDFEWAINWNGVLVLKKVPSYIIPEGRNDFFEDMKKSILGENNSTYTAIRPRLPKTTLIDYEIGFLLNFTSTKHIALEFEPVFVYHKKNGLSFKRLSLNKESNWPYLQSLSDDVYDTIHQFSDKSILRWLATNGGSNLTNHGNPWSYFQVSDLSKIRKRYIELFQKIWPMLCEWPYVYTLRSGTFSNKNICPVKLSKDTVQPTFSMLADNRFINLQCSVTLPERKAEIQKIFILKNLLFEIDDVLYLPPSVDSLNIIGKFDNGLLKFPLAEIKNVIKNILTPLREKYSVEMKGLSNVEYVDLEPQPRIMLSELDNQHLMIQPQFVYDDTIINYDTEHEQIEEADGKTKVIKRNKPEEVKVYEYLRSLHPKFSGQRNNQYYYLPFNEVMTNGWFLQAVQQLQTSGLPVFGLQELKKFKYNLNKPKFDIKSSNGVDWFDLKISVSWGDQEVNFKDLKKALISRQDTILLDDGTLGLIPEEWLKQYTPLMKLSSENNGSLRISKLHYALLDDINDQLDSEEVKKEIAEKKQRLLQYDTIQAAPLSKEVNATLRPYQLSGFNWLQALDSLGWGGCLADDMGLGKTLQTITFLQYLKEQKPGCTHLVVCPTSLIFNWEAELQKFCPSLKHHTYYGLQRTFDDDHFEQFDVILTTYGMVRNDFEHLQKFSWHYIILDESQTIKNPDALVTKAVQNLKAVNKLILSGTPVQNNTFDLYAQFTFLNPGLLGTREFFKNEFAHPIDKHGDKEKAAQLRRMIYPFILRRTKEQVAVDLPDKTEMILWCNMDKRQRYVYDEYKEYYRTMLLQKIDEEGLAKAGIYVLEGLLRLRQICDHPALLKDKNVSATDSVKIDELMREVQENTGEHKLLIFSQFTEMLSLIRDELVKNNIRFCYLDGSIAADKRKDQVHQFQGDASIKIFLISLKAGGVGLNLTSADYVYLVDPWWNPAAEQQAIDRTHRIGQTKKIFAYKMICKDSVEEKILQLQEKKKILATELVSEDSGFVKKLTVDDIKYLFS
jgi:SNF2 family DNA or RNA helicase